MTISIQYLGGFFDGEGHIGVNEVKDSNSLYHGFTVDVTNNHLGVLKAIQKNFRGKIVQSAIYGLKGNGVTYTLLWYSYPALDLLQAMLPYLIVKRPQAELAITYPMGRRGKKVTASMFNQREYIAKKLKFLKKDYKPTPLNNQPSRRLLETDLKVQEAVRLYRTGITQAEVAKILNEKVDNISYWLRTLGVSRGHDKASKLAQANSSNRLHNKPQVQAAIDLFHEGFTTTEIAVELKAKANTVSYWLRKSGLSRSLSEAQKLRRQREKLNSK